jgi:signal transduction histidine kinase
MVQVDMINKKTKFINADKYAIEDGMVIFKKTHRGENGLLSLVDAGVHIPMSSIITIEWMEDDK